MSNAFVPSNQTYVDSHRELAQDGNIAVYVDWRSPHTGAVIGLTPLRKLGLPAIPGEVSTKDPTISEQVESYAGKPSSANVDLVLLNGCINDLGVFVILDPRRTTAQLETAIKQACHNDMLARLKRTTAVFPGAKIVDTSYFAPLSDASAPVGPLLVAFLIAVDSPIQQIPGAIVKGALAPETRQRVIQNSLFFASKSTEQLALAVNDANAAVGGSLISFAFGPQNAALTGSTAWLFGVNTDGSAEDALAAPRKDLCKTYKDRTSSVVCIHGSAGHQISSARSSTRKRSIRSCREVRHRRQRGGHEEVKPSLIKQLDRLRGGFRLADSEVGKRDSSIPRCHPTGVTPKKFGATLECPYDTPAYAPTVLNAKRAGTRVAAGDSGSSWTALNIHLVPKAGLEPARISPHAPQTCASTNSATWAGV